VALWQFVNEGQAHRRMFKTLTGLSATCEGKKHDKKLADEQALRFPEDIPLTGFDFPI
jgi:hypothetical protein